MRSSCSSLFDLTIKQRRGTFSSSAASTTDPCASASSPLATRRTVQHTVGKYRERARLDVVAGAQRVHKLFRFLELRVVSDSRDSEDDATARRGPNREGRGEEETPSAPRARARHQWVGRGRAEEVEVRRRRALSCWLWSLSLLLWDQEQK